MNDFLKTFLFGAWICALSLSVVEKRRADKAEEWAEAVAAEAELHIAEMSAALRLAAAAGQTAQQAVAEKHP